MQGLSIFLLFHVLMHLGQIVQGSVIIHGRKAPENSLQYMVSVQNTGSHVCGGFLISDDFVVTAAHCGVSKWDYVLLGDHNLMGSNRKRINLEYICKHPFYKTVGQGDDIMLLKLAEKVPLDNGIKPIQLPASEINLRDNQMCSVAGWGRTENSPTRVVDDLRVVNVSIINPRVCRKQWSNELPPNVICAGGFQTKNGFCQGDSGGPLVCDGKAVGVVSFNRNANCNYPNVPNVYTDLSIHVSWINGILSKNKCSE